MNVFKVIFKNLILMLAGGELYCICEMLCRGRSHWCMVIVGGVCFWACGQVNNRLGWDVPLRLQIVICAGVITATEFISGCIVNLWLGWNVWDYSNMPFNVLGQICLPFTLLWLLISPVAIFLDDYTRYDLFGEEEPRYRW